MYHLIRITSLILLVSLLLLSLESCGFRLRGSTTIDLQMPVTAIKNVGVSNAMVSELRRMLRSAGTEVVDDVAQAEVLISFGKENQSRRVLSVGTSGKVQEYELHYTVGFDVKNISGEELMAWQTINRIRDYSFDETDVLAKSLEENLIYKDMRRDAINEILRRLQRLRQ